jgi:2,4-dienoyl-CoA reductase-like NADH-dependent reductase (Old Yellow Enzyme family)
MKKLFEMSKINQMELKNRFVRSATWEGMANSDGSCSEELTDLIVELAKEQVGLIISSQTYVNPTGQTDIRQLGIYGDRLITSYKKMVEKVHNEGSKIIMQINHAGAKSLVKLTKDKPFGPSSMEVKDCLNCREMTISEIFQIIEDFKNAAVRAKNAGFDGVQIYASHGYLLSQFLSPFFNKRTDEYGGSIKNRARLILEILRAIRFALGKKFTVIIKLNSEDFIEGGFTQSEMLQVAAMLESTGIDAIELSGSISLKISKYFSFREGRIDSKEEEVYYRDAAKLYKREIAVPLILVGGIRSYEVAKELVEKKQADYISLCRPLIREPGLIKRWQSGNTGRATCTSCNKCFPQSRTVKGIYCVLEKQK